MDSEMKNPASVLAEQQTIITMHHSDYTSYPEASEET